jgi:GNAT superfamily N-acetyltransferase
MLLELTATSFLNIKPADTFQIKSKVAREDCHCIFQPISQMFILSYYHQYYVKPVTQELNIRVFNNKDTEKVIDLISHIRINEYNLNFDLTGLDSDLLHIEDYYFKYNGCFWVAEDSSISIIGTTGLRGLKQFTSTCELNRMYVSSEYRRVGLGQKLLDKAIKFAKSLSYSIILLDTYNCFDIARKLYLKNGFEDIPRYNNNPRSQVFMRKKIY